jgi:type IX secretion system PorP/SprF family membrane protein
MSSKLKFATCVTVLFVISVSTEAQQYPVFTQYYFNELVINPAYAGNHVQLSLTSSYRNQWLNFPGAPRTFSVSGHSSFYKGKVGVGLLINHDEIGSYGNDNVYGYYSYKLHFRESTLSMGMSVGFNFYGVDFSALDLQNPGDPSFAPLSDLKPNFGAGIFYTKKNYFLGFSIPFILNNGFDSDIESVLAQIREARYYFLRGGIIFPVYRAKNIKLNPSFLARTQEGQPVSVDLNLGVVIYDVVSTGLSWRSDDALISFIDLKLSEKFHFAYSFDWTTSAIRQFSNGSHEFTLNYRAKVTQAHKNLQCPTYYHYR